MMKYRNRVLGLLCLLMMILYLDRVCISVAGPRIQDALHIGPVGWGWVAGVFTLAYALFEVPAGVLGDRIGARRVLTRIVIWWSVFTSLTGMAVGLNSLLVTRFFFGVGEAGAFPNASVVVARWFPVEEQGRAFGIVLMATQLGGVFAPLIVVPIQMRFGWRASFYVFGLIGMIWSAVWYFWFRDAPSEKAGVSREEVEETAGLPGAEHRMMPWGIALRSWNFWATLLVAFCYIYMNSFFLYWFHTYLVKGRGFREKDLLLSFLPFLMAAAANVAGGVTSHWLVKRIGLKWGRCAIGVFGLGMAAVFLTAVMFTHNPIGALVLLSLVNAGITFQQPIMFAVCLDIGGEFTGAMIGAMNMAAQFGAFVSSLIFGYLVGLSGWYDLPLIPMAVLLVVGALTWLMINPAERIGMVAGEA